MKWMHQHNTGVAMRIAVGFNFAVGIALIAFGCSIQNPPSAYPPVMFVFVGSLNMFASVAGFWGSYNKKLLLLLFLGVGGLSLLLQVAFEISLQFIFDKVVDQISPITQIHTNATIATDTTAATNATVTDDPASVAQHHQVSKELNIARWVLIGFIFVEVGLGVGFIKDDAYDWMEQVLTLVMAILLRYVIKEDVPYDSFDPENAEQRSLAIHKLSADVGKGRSTSERTYDKVRAKMASKYGQYTHGVDWYNYFFRDLTPKIQYVMLGGGTFYGFYILVKGGGDR
ncbi:MAG: hypothetical protein WDW36_010354 [Sanguina aurantia]